MYIGEMFSLIATYLPSDAKDAKVTWDSSDSSVASVNASGIVTAKGVGICEITATAGGKTDTCTVSVSYESVEVESVSLSMGMNTVMVMYVGDTSVFNANISPSNADDKSVSWQSSDNSVATVNATGKVTAVAVGEATITVTASGKSDSYRVSVRQRESESDESDGVINTTPETSQQISQPSPTPQPAQADVIYTVSIDTSNLPYGTQFVELPNGEIVELNGEDTITCEVCSKDINGGAFNIIALDSEKNALGAVDVSADDGGMNTFMIVLIALGTLMLGAAGTLLVLRYLAIRKKI
jgi:hypothetical protein